MLAISIALYFGRIFIKTVPRPSRYYLVTHNILEMAYALIYCSFGPVAVLFPETFTQTFGSSINSGNKHKDLMKKKFRTFA